MKMEPTKIENQIQEKLNSREIQPSAQAWDRLDAMLTVAEEKKTKRSPFLSFRFIGIAASFLIFPAIGILIYLENSNTELQDEIPTQKSQQTIVKSDLEVSGEIPKEENLIQVVQNEKQSITKNSEPITQNPQPKRVSIINQNQNQSNPVVNVTQKQEEVPQPFISQEVVVSIQKNDIAEVEIPLKKEIQVTKIKVNATSLLSQVDGELEKAYRETKLEKIARNFNTVKVALANRNNK
jgi:hypothetical protein